MLAQQEGRPEWGEGPGARPCRALALVLWWERERVRALEHVAAWQRSRAVAEGVGEQVERPGPPAGRLIALSRDGGGRQGSLLQWQRRTLGPRRSHGSVVCLRAGPSDTQTVDGTLKHFASRRPSCGDPRPGASLLLSIEGLKRHNPCRAVESALHGRRPSGDRPSECRSGSEPLVRKRVSLKLNLTIWGHLVAAPLLSPRRRTGVVSPSTRQFYSRARTWGKRVVVLNPRGFGRYYARTLADTVNN